MNTDFPQVGRLAPIQSTRGFSLGGQPYSFQPPIKVKKYKKRRRRAKQGRIVFDTPQARYFRNKQMFGGQRRRGKYNIYGEDTSLTPQKELLFGLEAILDRKLDRDLVAVEDRVREQRKKGQNIVPFGTPRQIEDAKPKKPKTPKKPKEPEVVIPEGVEQNLRLEFIEPEPERQGLENPETPLRTPPRAGNPKITGSIEPDMPPPALPKKTPQPTPQQGGGLVEDVSQSERSFGTQPEGGKLLEEREEPDIERGGEGRYSLRSKKSRPPYAEQQESEQSSESEASAEEELRQIEIRRDRAKLIQRTADWVEAQARAEDRTAGIPSREGINLENVGGDVNAPDRFEREVAREYGEPTLEEKAIQREGERKQKSRRQSFTAGLSRLAKKVSVGKGGITYDNRPNEPFANPINNPLAEVEGGIIGADITLNPALAESVVSAEEYRDVSIAPSEVSTIAED